MPVPSRWLQLLPGDSSQTPQPVLVAAGKPCAVGPRLASVVCDPETFVNSEANTEFHVDSQMENSRHTMDCRFPYAVFTVHFLKLGFNFSM